MNESTLKYINENNLVSFMNKTKWRELAISLASNSNFEPKVSIKILGEPLASGFSHLDWEWVKYGESSCIEWIEIDPIKREYLGRLVSDRETDYSKFIEQTLGAFNIPYTLESSLYKVWGYANANKHLSFV